MAGIFYYFLLVCVCFFKKNGPVYTRNSAVCMSFSPCISSPFSALSQSWAPPSWPLSKTQKHNGPSASLPLPPLHGKGKTTLLGGSWRPVQTLLGVKALSRSSL